MSETQLVTARLEELARRGVCCLHLGGAGAQCSPGSSCSEPAPELAVVSTSVHLASCTNRTVRLRGCPCLPILPGSTSEGGLLAELVLLGVRAAEIQKVHPWWRLGASWGAQAALSELSWAGTVGAMCLPGAAYRGAMEPVVAAWAELDEAARLVHVASWLGRKRLGRAERRELSRRAEIGSTWLWLVGGGGGSPLADDPLTMAWLCYGGPTITVAGCEIATMQVPEVLVEAALSRCREEHAYGSSGWVYVHRGVDPASLGIGRTLTRDDVLSAGELTSAVEVGLGLWGAARSEGTTLSLSQALELGEAATRV